MKKQAGQSSQIIRVKSTGVSSLKGFYPDRLDKENQDSLFLKTIPQGCFAGVADGHGYYGEHVSRFVTSLCNSFSFNDISHPVQMFNKISSELFRSGIDLNYSGCTLSTVFITNQITVANIGDSPVFLGSSSGSKSKILFNGNLVSAIHKLEDRAEAQRISKSGGRITWGPPSRLWLRDRDVPGLCVTRAFGDSVGGSVGVVSEPFISNIAVNGNDKFLVIASDGVTDWLGVGEICQIVRPFFVKNDAQTAAERIVSAARSKCTGDTVDDMSCVVIFFEI